MRSKRFQGNTEVTGSQGLFGRKENVSSDIGHVEYVKQSRLKIDLKDSFKTVL